MNTEEKLELAIGALADIAFSDDITTLKVARKKAKRIYEQLRAKELAEEGGASTDRIDAALARYKADRLNRALNGE